MEAWQIVLLVLVALLAIPGALALFELRSTLRELRVFLQDTGGRLNQTLDEARKTLEDLNRASASVQQGADRLRGLAEDLAGFGSIVRSVSDGFRGLTEGVIAATAAALRSLFTREETKEPAPSKETEEEPAS